jgi:hypothetical protein
MNLLLLSILSLSYSWDWIYTLREGVCNSTSGLNAYSTAVIDTKFYQITRSSYGDMNYGACSWAEFHETDNEFQNYTFYVMFQDGKYYENEFTIEWYTQQGHWGKGNITEYTHGSHLPFEVLETDFETYYVYYSCTQADENYKRDYFAVYATTRDFDSSIYFHYAYDRGFTDEQLENTLLDVEYCGEYTIRTN